MAQKVQFRRGTEAQGKVTVLDQGEPGFDVDQQYLRIGDGVNAGGVKYLPAHKSAEILGLVTDLQGGDPVTDLDGQPLTAEDAGRHFITFRPAAGMEVWLFRAGDEATNTGLGLVRHADWADGDFEFVFARRH
jgi:hypothetical protein